jgi:hypothetical protein
MYKKLVIENINVPNYRIPQSRKCNVVTTLKTWCEGFVTPDSWRRKNMLKALNCLALWTLSLVVLMPVAAQSADTEFCQAYAKAAVEQASIGRSHRACAAGMEGPRWSPTFQVHFGYCMTQPIEVVEGGTHKRAEYLHSCGAIS